MLSVMLFSLGCSLILLFFVWCIYLLLGNPGIVDLFWPLVIMLNALIYGLIDHILSNYLWLVYITPCLWGGRLAGYLLFTRVIPQHIEKRYIDLSKDWKIKHSIGFLLNYLFQGFLAWVIAIPFLFMQASPIFTWLFYLAITTIVISTILESIADRQLHQFKRKHTGKVCKTGLWRYSRHPNLFFEWLIWVGFALVAISMSLTGWISIVSPGLLFYIMYYLTAPITEKGSLKSRGEQFKQYQQKVSYFFPWISK